MLNDQIEANSQKISWIHDEWNADRLFIDDSFQRKTVWLPKHKVRLIESILLDYPIPEIYLWALETDPETGKARLSVVDGQQRIKAITEFISGQFELVSEHLDDATVDFANSDFDRLSGDRKKALWDYKIRIRTIPSQVTRGTIVTVFKRLNETDKSINPQEFRNAEFNGEFIDASVQIADLSIWSERKIFSADNVRRMGDIQFASQLLIYLRSGIESELSQDAINRAYDDFNTEYDEKDVDIAIVISFTKALDFVIEHGSPLTRRLLKSPTHIYTLFGVLCALSDDFTSDPASLDLVTKLDEFSDLYYNDPDNVIISDYREASRAGVLQKQRRVTRFNKLKNFLID